MEDASPSRREHAGRLGDALLHQPTKRLFEASNHQLVKTFLQVLGGVVMVLVLGAPEAALVTVAAAHALALVGLVVSFAFETACEGDRRRSRGGHRLPAKPDRAVRAGTLPVARIVG